MDITDAILLKLEKLSSIRIDNTKKDEYITKLKSVFTYIASLSSVSVENVIPLSQVTHLENNLREDTVTPSFTQEEALMNAMHTYNGYFKVPKVIE